MAEIAVINNSKPSFFAANRKVVIAGSVLLFHVLAIWALQTGLLMRAVEIIVPVEVLAQLVEEKVELPTPKADPAPPKPPEPVKQEVSKPKPAAQLAPTLLAVADAAPTPNAPSVQPIAQPAPAAPFIPTVAVAAVTAPTPPATPAAPKIVLPSSDADYLRNPKPYYPPMSNRMREQGTAVYNVLIGVNGLPLKAELLKSSGFERLDESALSSVMKWRYVPGKRYGVIEEMWYSVPVKFSLTGDL